MVAMGGVLREKLHAGQWRILNETLPVVCFTDATAARRRPKVCQPSNYKGSCKECSTREKRGFRLPCSGGEQPAIRACITCFRSGPNDVDRLVAALDDARRAA